MLYDALLTHEEKALRDEVRRFVRDEVPADLLRAMDRDETKFPYEFIDKLAKHGLRGKRELCSKQGKKERTSLKRGREKRWSTR